MSESGGFFEILVHDNYEQNFLHKLFAGNTTANQGSTTANQEIFWKMTILSLKLKKKPLKTVK